jgi:hypothetical protein
VLSFLLGTVVALASASSYSIGATLQVTATTAAGYEFAAGCSTTASRAASALRPDWLDAPLGDTAH